jgi:hypothetical protein
LGHAINDTVSESDRITGAIAGVRAHGYDIVLKLDATIGLAKRDAAAAEAAKLTTLDKRFLESLRIQVDQESMTEDNDKKPVPRLSMTPQDVRFLKSLRIATDELECSQLSRLPDSQCCCCLRRPCSFPRPLRRRFPRRRFPSSLILPCRSL